MLVATLLALAAAAVPATDEDIVVPKSFQACASAWRQKHWEATEDQSFDCTKQYFDDLPGAAGSTHSMGDASVAAVVVGHAYALEIARTIQVTRSDPGDPDQHTRNAFIDALVAQRDAYARAMCGLRYDAWWDGTIRSVIAGSCQVRETDELIEDLLELLHDYDRDLASGNAK